ncbi:MAG: hypothetical protein JSV39_02070 [Candidatus Aenigmatarchaeota archaeon]|nr:MAG: hypothetical protein JSV39_02070 [Candidatus Aenigmarchaeota archaeon]
MDIAKIIYPTFTFLDQLYFGRIYFLCPSDCIFGEYCKTQKAQKNYERVEGDWPENIYELIQDDRKKVVRDEFERHRKARTGRRIRCPSGKYTFKITKDFTEINGSALDEPFNEYQEILMRECVAVESTS